MLDDARRIIAANPRALAREALGLTVICACIAAGFSLPLLDF